MRRVNSPRQAEFRALWWYLAGLATYLVTMVLIMFGVPNPLLTVFGFVGLVCYGRGQYNDGWADGWRAELP